MIKRRQAKWPEAVSQHIAPIMCAAGPQPRAHVRVHLISVVLASRYAADHYEQLRPIVARGYRQPSDIATTARRLLAAYSQPNRMRVPRFSSPMSAPLLDSLPVDCFLGHTRRCRGAYAWQVELLERSKAVSHTLQVRFCASHLCVCKPTRCAAPCVRPSCPAPTFYSPAQMASERAQSAQEALLLLPQSSARDALVVLCHRVLSSTPIK